MSERAPGALAGRRVAVTRAEPGALADALREAGASVVHVPLIAIGPPADGGRSLAGALARLASFDWLVVTSVNGVRAVAEAVTSAPAGLRVAAVGAATAAALAEATGRPADLVPSVERGEGLVAAFPVGPWRVLVAQAQGAAATVADGLAAAGHDVEIAIAYATTSRAPGADERRALASVDAVVFASGSAVTGWGDAGFGPGPAVVAIGPSTADACRRAGLGPDEVAAAPDAAAIVTAVGRALGARSGADPASP